jgi:hypothetical protein
VGYLCHSYPLELTIERKNERKTTNSKIFTGFWYERGSQEIKNTPLVLPRLEEGIYGVTASFL